MLKNFGNINIPIRINTNPLDKAIINDSFVNPIDVK